jgi:hypothetical protein
MKQLNQALTVCIWIVALTYVIFTRSLSAFLIWWGDNGDKVLTRLVQFIILFIDAIGNTYYAGKNFRRWSSVKFAQVSDYFFYQLTVA